MKRLFYILALVLGMVQLTSCEVEFSPNADYKEVPVVYCILNQDEDTTWARIQKCYLGENDLNSYTDIKDSTNYPEGAIEVKLLQSEKPFSGIETIKYSFPSINTVLSIIKLSLNPISLPFEIST